MTGPRPALLPIDPTRPAQAFGRFVGQSLDILAALGRRPLAWRELVVQIGFVARVSLLPTIVITLPFTVLSLFLLNILLTEIGANDLSGAGTGLIAVTQLGPLVTAIVVAGTGASAMCADLGARTIREEIDALRVIGVDPIRALALPRTLAATIVALMLFAVAAIVGLIGSYIFAVYVQHTTPGAFVAGLTLLTGAPEIATAILKTTVFGLSAGLIACYKGLSVGSGPAAVGNAVNETVVYSFMALFLMNLLITAVAVKVTM